VSVRGVIGVPATVHSRWSAFRPCLEALERPPGTVVKEAHGSSEAENRHRITAWALEQGAEWIFWLDDDLLFRPDVLVRTLARSQAIVLGLSLFRRPEDGQFWPIWSHAGPDSGRLWDQVRTIRPEPHGLMRLGGGGAGGLLTRTEVFRAIGEPYWRKHPDDVFETSADIDFLWRAQRAGFTVWGDPDVRYGHLTSMAIWPHHTAEHGWSTIFARGFEPFAAQDWSIPEPVGVP